MTDILSFQDDDVRHQGGPGTGQVQTSLESVVRKRGREEAALDT